MFSPLAKAKTSALFLIWENVEHPANVIEQFAIDFKQPISEELIEEIRNSYELEVKGNYYTLKDKETKKNVLTYERAGCVLFNHDPVTTVSFLPGSQMTPEWMDLCDSLAELREWEDERMNSKNEEAKNKDERFKKYCLARSQSLQ